MKILKLLSEARQWTEAGWVGGASDEGHDDFDPLQREFGGMRRRLPPRYSSARPENPYKQTTFDTVLKVPFAQKDAFKALVGVGKYQWDAEGKVWKVHSSTLTPEMLQALAQIGVSVAS